jgi:hypothetical protein
VYFKLLSGLLAALLVAESVFLYVHRSEPNRFTQVEAYEGFVAFDTSSGQLCKTLKTKSVAEIQAESKREAAPKRAELKNEPPVDDHDFSADGGPAAALQELRRQSSEQSQGDPTVIFVASLPT